ncbi:MAG: hypothetical protein A2117_00150 [Candidatus Wildermuthbacteria bacterium GWA2_46_15]|uniref:Homing endonuclease LAGLIDADG domain-containing protein n=1 Tax=Candidatus Wildermuthbacteria bacterium GWA2_46_15 TaxID=1802443 RepID=A0A1G2QMR1_9BACT|nr:MAG: hypothetical protein A2117_00150 [Candidatus Wildermuthbacteria bacterium GWA2_46_15]
MDNTVGSRQGDIIIGTLLGDGFLERNGAHVRLIMVHSFKQKSYVEWKTQQLINLRGQVLDKRRFDSRTQKFYYYSSFRSQTSPFLEKYYQLFYQNGKKIIPSKLPKIITPLILAIWLMDDGYKRNDCNALRLNTQSYSAEEHHIIQQALSRMGIESKIHKQDKYLVTYIPSRSMNQLRRIVREFIVPDMEYKIV